MINRSVFALVVLISWPLRGQDPVGFAPPKPYRAQLEERGPVRDIGLRDAIAAALRSNLDIEIEGYNRDSARASTANAYSYYDPVLGLNMSLVSSNVPTTNILQTGQ